MITREITVKNILSKSKVFEYVVNPYVGCQHNCTYCYARFMKRFAHHSEPWGEFVDIKINAPELLLKQIKNAPPGRVWVSGVCDPYQPLEKTYALTRRCLEILLKHGWPVTVQTKSPLVLRDMDLMQDKNGLEVGFSIATADEEIRRLFEPHTPPVSERISALEQLHGNGIKTFVMIAPLLPGAERLPELLKENVDYILIDRMNYHYGDHVYKKYRLERAMSDDFFQNMSAQLNTAFTKMGIDCEIVF